MMNPSNPTPKERTRLASGRGSSAPLAGRLDRFLALGALALLGPACAPGADAAHGIVAKLAFEPAPHVGEVRCTVTLEDAAGEPVECTELQLEGNMNHAGMVPVFSTALGIAQGEFQAPMNFTMGGDWLIFVRGTTLDGDSFEVVCDVPGVRQALPAESAPVNDEPVSGK